MWSLFFKEINGFFSSITGYVVIIVFLLVNSLFMWVFPGPNNILDAGYANLDTLFNLAPWIFLFLVPAVTMRLFAEEKKSGTIELLYTRPLTDLQIVAAKYLAGVVLVLFALIPAFIYFISVYFLGTPVGNIDTGGTWGSFIGLFFLACIYVATGVFSSSLTDNQIVAFIMAMLFSFIMYLGFNYISDLFSSGSVQGTIAWFGIDYHYQSMSRGVIDSRDIIYFAGVVTIFILSTRTVLETNKK